ncbi:MAG: hypothetical protein US25_C0035G0006 [Candidatus Moranbacteria bacterium GW2011_GWE1_36_7]|nr:MAG: hypothetical protein UR99_C0007G0012 [Candidatus Moranbacteria bacterium GW2011_GWD2_36_12]KKQ06876.1 MAG: hypothetical protein US16_C0007G0016 [Candidatus Moranbacteria bacterium GW2011_GWE2_36_40]KKQ13728.1 MAG: hypothetical protein US25_C0035G0006 [Candidatus Moranbacteria bacterium GW2011_GWE1_36_7]
MKTEETVESFAQCFKLNSRRRKIVAAFLILVIGVAIVALTTGLRLKLHEKQFGGRMIDGYDGKIGYSSMMRSQSGFYGDSNANNFFAIPQDAAKSGEVALVVEDLDVARKAISSIALKNGGIIYFENISYASENLKNGSVVVQIPLEKFDATFANFKNVGSRIIKESTEQIPLINYYPMAAQEKNVANQDVSSSDSATSTSSIEPMIYPAPQQVSQNKGYIRVVFVDYGKKEYQNRAFGIFGSSQNINGLWIALGLKFIVLIILFVVLLLVFQKIIRDIRAARAAKKAKTHHVHIASLASTSDHLRESRRVRQMPKSSQRVVRIARKK